MLKVSFSRLLFIFVVTRSGVECTVETARKDTLQLVQVIFRHGDRAPTYTYPADPYNDTPVYWPEGLAQLTNRGKMQQYELGQYLRHRYDGYLGTKYNPKELYVTSSDMDRTIMSLESNLAGLFPPVSRWNPNIEWQPIPLRTIPWRDDKLLHNNVKCPRYNELRREFLSSSDVVRRMNEENEEFIRYCAEHSGLSTVKTVKDLYPLLDVLYAQSEHNFTLPEWAIAGNVLDKLINLYAVINTWPTYTAEMKRLWGGPLLNLLIKNMQAIAGHLGSNPEDAHSVSHGVNRKMLMYSAHDSTLARIMNTMGVFEPHCPGYASALLVELHQDSQTREYFIELHYRNDTRKAPVLLTPAKCEYPCKLRTFMEINHALIPVDWGKECQMDSSKPFSFFPLKMHEHDDHDDGEFGENGSGSAQMADDFDCRQPQGQRPYNFYSGLSLQLVLVGVGLLTLSGLAAVVVKSLQKGNCKHWDDANDDNDKSCCTLARFWHAKPHVFGSGGSGYESI